LPGPVDRLELFWSPDGKESVFQVNLDQGPDLDRFSPLIRNQTLADLAYGPHRLVRRDLVLGGHQARLYRLTWPHGTRGPVLSKVAAHFRLKANEPDRAWKSLTATPASDRPGAFEFDAGGFFPIDRIRIRPIQKNTLAQVALFSRTRPSDPWRPRGNHWVHRLEVDGIPLESDPVALDGGTDRYFRLEADPKSGGLGAGIPEIAIGWRPRMVYFVARGEGPFTLAYGHHSAQPAQTAVEPGLKAVQADPAAVLVRPARPGPIGPLGGPDRLKPPPEPFPWKKAMVWTVLVLGVALLGFLAWRLFRQLPKGEEPGDPSEPKGPL
jgi:hypothetical protein